MNGVLLRSETDFSGWRAAARALVLNNIAPTHVTWSVEGANELFTPWQLPAVESGETFNVSAAFVDLARIAILNRDSERFALLYRLLWRLRAKPDLMKAATDGDMARIAGLAREVRRDEHKMHAFVRFREFGRDDDFRFVAWFEPSHHIVELSAPFFERRFADMAWSILTPDRCAHWDGRKTIFTPGAKKSDAPSGDPLESIWLTYYASIFNPARLKIKAMQSEMPKKYWCNLPEASLIDPLIAKAGRAMQKMIDSKPAPPRASPQRKEQPMIADKIAQGSLDKLRMEVEQCRNCHLWKDATQAVFGDGPQNARIMMVGEQPGDKEDLAGRPFVGPAGEMLDRGLKDAGIDRGEIYVTNAVKHFKFEPRGKIRLHQKPNMLEILACRSWYIKESEMIKPALVVAMGATAIHSVFGKAVPVGKIRGRPLDLDGRTQALVTVHPSYLLRLPDENSKAREYEMFVRDLKIAADILNQLKSAA